VSPRVIPALADAEIVAAELNRWPGVEWSALAASLKGVTRALDAGLRNIEYVISAADGHSVANVGRDTAQVLNQLPDAIRAIHQAGGSAEVIVATAWDCPFDGPTPLERVRAVADRAAELGADRVCLADTIGTASPIRVVRLLEMVRREHPELGLGLHMHDTRGMALASIVSALRIGVVNIDASVGGLGGCPFAPGASGNVATEEVAYCCRDMGIETGIQLDHLIAAASNIQRVLGRELPSRLLKAGDRALHCNEAGSPRMASKIRS
jgi:hydroxymethylglutaryl-CoA lyase